MSEQTVKNTNSQKLSDEVFAAWEKVGLLNATEGEFKKKQLVQLLEHQKAFNSTKDHFFYKCTIPIVVRIFNNSIISDLVSVQVIPQAGEFKHKNLHGKIQTIGIQRGLKKLKSSWTNPVSTSNKDMNLAHLAEKSIELMEGVVSEINREVIADLQQTAGTVFTHFWKSPKNLFDSILMTSSNMVRKIGTQANWIIVSPQIADELTKLEEWAPVELDLTKSLILARKAAKLAKKWDVYVDPLMENETVLLGFKGDEYQAGYFYCPSLLLDQDDDGFILTRYGKNMVDKGYYAKINLENYSVELEEWYPTLEPTLLESEIINEVVEEELVEV